MDPLAFDLGAVFQPPGTTHFRVWAPHLRQVSVRILGQPDRHVPMQRDPYGYFTASVEDVHPGARYFFRLDNHRDRPDPATRYQPDGVHGPSQVVDLYHHWKDEAWKGRPLGKLVLYELHVGTFTPEGTFDAAVGQLDRLCDLGITAVELMPVAQFPGSRNWGYDGVGLFAVQNSYGGPWGLQRFVDAAHQRGLAVILDVVYNHLGPEGNYLREFAPYFTDRYRIPWGDAVNFDGAGSDEVRRFVIANALFFQTHFRLDGLRLDAVPFIKDGTARHVLAELAEHTQQQAQKLGRPFHLIAESDLNDTRLTRPLDKGGYGLSATWSDDFHHAVHALLTGERSGYYADHGGVEQLARVYRDGFLLTGQYSHFRGRRHGSATHDCSAEEFVVCIQNHDQVGNRAQGDRLGALVDFESLKLAAGLMLLSPYVPMLFMGEEYGEEAPFQYFIQHSDGRLIEGVRRGRRQEFAAFGWKGEVPDPQDEATFHRSKLRPHTAEHGRGRVLYDFYRTLLRLRREIPALARCCKKSLEVHADEPRITSAGVLHVRRWAPGSELAIVFRVSAEPGSTHWPWAGNGWHKIFDSSGSHWQGPGSGLPDRVDEGSAHQFHQPPRSFGIYQRHQGA